MVGGELTMHRKKLKQTNCWKLSIITVTAHPELRRRTKSTKKSLVLLSGSQTVQPHVTFETGSEAEKKGQKPLMILTFDQCLHEPSQRGYGTSFEILPWKWKSWGTDSGSGSIPKRIKEPSKQTSNKKHLSSWHKTHFCLKKFFKPRS